RLPLSFALVPLPPSSTLFPYTTLFRSPARSGATPAGTPRRAGSASRSPRPSSRFLLRVAVLHVDLPAARPQRLAERRRDRHGSVDRKSTRLNSSHVKISYAVFCLKKKS